MKKKFVDVNYGSVMNITVDDIKYEFKVLEYSNVGGYAPILIIDCHTGTHYLSDGYLELNGHIFISRWDREYANYRDNWICNHDLIISVE